MRILMPSEDIVEDNKIETMNIDIQPQPKETFHKYPYREEKPAIPKPIKELPLILKFVYYTLIIFLFCILILAIVGTVWFNSTFSEFKDRDFSSKTPVYINSTQFNEFTNNQTNNYKHEINNEIKPIIKTNITLIIKNDIPDDLLDDMTEDIIDNVVERVVDEIIDEINRTLFNGT